MPRPSDWRAQRCHGPNLKLQGLEDLAENPERGAATVRCKVAGRQNRLILHYKATHWLPCPAISKILGIYIAEKATS